jgi:hypothetical protein
VPGAPQLDEAASAVLVVRPRIVPVGVGVAQRHDVVVVEPDVRAIAVVEAREPFAEEPRAGEPELRTVARLMGAREGDELALARTVVRAVVAEATALRREQVRELRILGADLTRDGLRARSSS